MSKGIQRLLSNALRNVEAEISVNARGASMYQRGLSGEGYAGGYRDAIHDVQAALRGLSNHNSRYWPKETGKKCS